MPAGLLTEGLVEHPSSVPPAPTATGILIADGVLTFNCLLKGKYRTALFGLLLPSVGADRCSAPRVPAIDLGTTSLPGKRLERATRRGADFDRRWAPSRVDWKNFVGGKPSQPNPSAPTRPVTTSTAEPGRMPGPTRPWRLH